MRVIFLTHNYPRHPGDLPGGFLHPLALALQAAGVDIRVVAPSDAGRGGRDLVDSIPVRRVRYAPAAWEFLAYTGRMAAAGRDPRALLALVGMVRALRKGARLEAEDAPGPVVIHAHWWFPAGMAAPPGLPSVVTLHGTDGRLLLGSAVARWVGRRVLARAAMVTTVSAALAESVVRTTGIKVGPAAVQGLPLDASCLHPTRGGGGIVSVARLTTQKRLDLLVEAVGLLRDANRPVRLVIVGDGPEFGRLEALIQARGLASLVRLAGGMGPDGVAEVLSSADLFVLPARGEGYGLAAAEALIAGVPLVVCQDGGGLLEIAGTGQQARVVAPSPAAIADAIAGILADPAARGAALEAGALLRARLEPAAAARRAMEWYRLAVGQSR